MISRGVEISIAGGVVEMVPPKANWQKLPRGPPALGGPGCRPTLSLL
jgi:hypothetical protein